MEDLREEVGRFNTVVVDAAVEGVVLHDGLGIFGEVREMVREEVERRGVKRDERG